MIVLLSGDDFSQYSGVYSFVCKFKEFRCKGFFVKSNYHDYQIVCAEIKLTPTVGGRQELYNIWYLTVFY